MAEQEERPRVPLAVAGAYAAPQILDEFRQHEPIRRILSEMLPSTLALTWVEPRLVVQEGRRNLVNTNWAGGVLRTGARAPNAGAASTLDGYATGFNSQEHVNFIGTDFHVYELAYVVEQWVFRDLTAETGAPDAVGGSALAGYSTEFNEQQHVIFVGVDLHVHELIYDNGWHHTDLTLAAGAAAMPPAIDTALAGYVTGFNEQHHVIYVGSDQHVHELMYDGAWHHADLSALAPGAIGPLPRPASPLAGYATEFNSQQHVLYVDRNGLIHELMYDGAWHHANLTITSGAANSPVAANGTMAGYVTGFNNQQHVVYISFDAHVHELMHDGAWHHTDLHATIGAAALPAISGSAIDGYATPFDEQQHVNYIGTDNHVHELFFDDAWHHNDLVTLSGGPPNARAGSPLAGFATAYNHQQHVIYIDTSNRVQELYFEGSWKSTNLTNAAVGSVQVVPWITALGSWTIPTVSKPNMPPGTSGGWESSSWVGIDGQNSNDVLQAGVRQRVDGDGDASYYAWIEWFAPEQPGSPGYIHETKVENLPVGPGQKMFCVVRYIDNQTKGSLLLINQDTGQFTSITLDPPPGAAFLGNTIEWIMEAPDSGPPDTSLPQFDPVVFTLASGVDLGGGLGDPNAGTTVNVTRESVVLTKTSLAPNTVTIEYLPWHAGDPTATASGPNVAVASSLDAYSTAFNEQQHINYLGTDGHVHELLFDNAWSDHDLSVDAGALGVLPIANTALAGYSTEFNEQQHVIYIGFDLHVHELIFDNGWHHTDLTLAAGAAAMPPAANSALAGYVTGFNEQQHVIYQGADQHVHELMYDGAWHHADLSVLAAGALGVLPRPGSSLCGYATEFSEQQHVCYIDVNGLIHELMYDGSWHESNLTLVSGAANSPAAAGSMLAGYVTGFNSQQHVVYLSFDAHVHELMHDGAWHHSDLHVLAGGAVSAMAGSAIDGYATTFDEQQHVNYIGADGHVHEIFFEGGWRHNDLSAQSPAAPIRPGTPLAGYATAFNHQEHVVYIGADNHVHELWF